MSRFTICQECGDKLRHVAIFCAKCGQPSCSWHCHTQHLNQHSHEPQPVQETPEPHALSVNVAAPTE